MKILTRGAIETREDGTKVYYLGDGIFLSQKDIKKHEKTGLSLDALINTAIDSTTCHLVESANKAGFELIEDENIEIIPAWTTDLAYVAIVRGLFRKI